MALTVAFAFAIQASLVVSRSPYLSDKVDSSSALVLATLGSVAALIAAVASTTSASNYVFVAIWSFFAVNLASVVS